MPRIPVHTVDDAPKGVGLPSRPLAIRIRRYRTAYGHNLRRGLTVSRADVAQLMLRLIEQPAAVGQTVGIDR
jgi:hypothetical protein